ncbi:MAG: PD-(D/E)XK nuclease family protein, partial [Patescibacteria group bacterium]
DGGVEIVDYKTGKSKDQNKFAFADKEQLLLYQIAAEDIGETVSQLTYHYLEDGSRVSFLGSAQEKDRLKTSISETLGDMRTSEFKATPGWHCQFCDFRDICEYRK